MMLTTASSGCSKFLSNAVVMGAIATIALLWGFFTFYADNQDTQVQLDNQAVQIMQQKTQIAISAEQNQLQSQELTLVSRQFELEGQVLASSSLDNDNLPLTATAFSAQVSQIEGTRHAIATRQTSIEATQTAVAKPQSTPPLVIRAEDVIPQIKNGDNGVPNTFDWWKEYEPTGQDGIFTPSPIPAHKCFGVAWNTNQYGYHHLLVFQHSMSITFASGGWYVKVCIPEYIIISTEDIGKIKADWLGKQYGDTQNQPWRVITNP